MPDKRKYRRCEAQEGTLVLACDAMSKVVDICSGGLSLMLLLDMRTSIPEEFSFDLLSKDCKVILKKIPGKLAWEEEISLSTFSGFVYKKAGVEFGSLSVEQHDLLNEFLLNYTTASV